MTIDLDELQALITEYKATLDDQDKDEGYTTARGFAQEELDAFMGWLQGRQAVAV